MEQDNFEDQELEEFCAIESRVLKELEEPTSTLGATSIPEPDAWKSSTGTGLQQTAFNDRETWAPAPPQRLPAQPQPQQSSFAQQQRISTPPSASASTQPQVTAPEPEEPEEERPSAVDIMDLPQTREILTMMQEEVLTYRSEQAMLKQARQKYEQAMGEIASERQLAEERAAFEAAMREEQTKLRKEKQALQVHAKTSAQQMAKDREENAALKAELAAAKDELLESTTRSKAAAKRMQTRIDQLTQDNDALKVRTPTSRMGLGRSSPLITPFDVDVVLGLGVRGEQKELQAYEERRLNAQWALPPSSAPAAAAPAPTRPPPQVAIPPAPAAGSLVPTQQQLPPASPPDMGRTLGLNETSPGGGPPGPRAFVAPGFLADGGLQPPTNSGPAVHLALRCALLAAQHGPARADIPPGDDGLVKETQTTEKRDRVYASGRRVVLFRNGTRKEVVPIHGAPGPAGEPVVSGYETIIFFANGDIRQNSADGRCVYHYAEVQTTHTTFPDGLQVRTLQPPVRCCCPCCLAVVPPCETVYVFPNKQVEKHYPDRSKEIIFPDKTIKRIYPNGDEESRFPDGTLQRVTSAGERIVEFPNHQKARRTPRTARALPEIHSPDGTKRKEFPDGTVKIIHADGRQETRYPDGRVKIKDANGYVLHEGPLPLAGEQTMPVSMPARAVGFGPRGAAPGGLPMAGSALGRSYPGVAAAAGAMPPR
ncbi:putative centromere protein J [Paratrimastix pyriformis]|uniref:Centromere protein J n=1 Tax=Paratrimastix pyriformis TaxID=342808 RepID=A0ABQ8UIE5_9EUKA|nr:putative centromere protein J [Paratrimastix pyriformis]